MKVHVQLRYCWEYLPAWTETQCCAPTHGTVCSLIRSMFLLSPPQKRMSGFKLQDGNRFMNSARSYEEATGLTKLHGTQPSLVQTLANWQWHVSPTSYPTCRTRPSGLGARCLPLDSPAALGGPRHIHWLMSGAGWPWRCGIIGKDIE